MYRIKAACVVALLLWSAAAAAQLPLPLHYGSNLFSFGASGESAMAQLGRRENFNAHGFDMLTLYVKPGPAGDLAYWQLATLFDGDKEALYLTAGGGADCMLHDFRIVRERPGGDPVVLVAQRDAGESYADAAPVHFKHYILQRNTAGMIGHPLYYFLLDRSFDAKRPYCDVGDAFKQELGIKAYR
ncbi:MAG: hypothetical protein ACJ8HI_13640 [Massilia sp.]